MPGLRPKGEESAGWMIRAPGVWILGLSSIAGMGYLDYVTGRDFSFSIFYLFAVAYMTWFGGWRAGLTGALASGAAWFFAQAVEDLPGHMAVLAWNAAVELVSFLIFAGVADALRRALHLESELARTDELTGLANRRLFMELAEMEIKRILRYEHPLSLGYLDLDNFKEVNDRLGHGAGDVLLRLVGKTLRASVRSTDILARMGGDEFAILMPETGERAAREVASKIRERFARVLQGRDPKVTVSLGLATWMRPPESLDELLRSADGLMYKAKEAGGDGFRHEVLDE